MTDDAVVLLVHTRQEARHIYQVHQREIEGVAEADETCCLIRSIHIQAAGHHIGLVGNDAYAAAVKAGKAGDDIGSEMLMHFVELAVIHDAADDILHIVRSIRVVRHHAVQRLILTIRVIASINNRSILHVVAGQEGQEVANLLDAVVLVLSCEMSHAAAAVVGHSAAQSLRGDFLSGDGLDDRRAGDEHLAGVLHHVDEVRDSRAVYSTACAGSHDDGNLGDNAGSCRVAEEDAAIAGQSVNGLLDAGTAGIVDADAGSPHLHGQIHDLPNLVGMLLTKGAALYGEVLGKGIDQTPIHRTVAGDNTLTRQVFLVLAEVGAAMLHKHIQLYERTFIEKLLDALTGSVLALGMLLLNAGGAAPLHNMLFLGFHQINFLLNCSHYIPPREYGASYILHYSWQKCKQFYD